MRSVASFVVLAVALAAPAVAQEPKRGQELIAEEGLRDHDYLFELRRPQGIDWRLLPEAEVREISPEAVAGLVRSAPSPAFGFVVVEPAPDGAAAGDMARLIVDGMPLTEKQVEREEQVTFAGQPAVRVTLRGATKGVSLRYVVTVVRHREHIYQLVAGGLRTNIAEDGSTVEPLWRAFRFLPGEKVLGRSQEALRAARGVGWRVVDGRFESAASGLVIPTIEGWRTAVGTNLETMSANAEVGLVGTSPAVYAAFIDEPAVGDGSALEAVVRRRFTEAKGAQPDGELKLRLCGREVVFTRRPLEASGIRFEYLHGVLVAEGRVVQVEAWWAAGTAGAVEALGAALGKVELRGADARGALAAELLREGDPQSFVGETIALRRGELRDFEFDLRWKKPTALWSVTAPGPDQGEFARCQLNEAASGVYGILAAERLTGLDAPRFHSTIISMVCPEGRPQAGPEVRKVGAHELRISFIDQDGELPLTYVIVTSLAGDRGIRLVLWGTQEHVAASRPLFLAAADALQVSKEDLKPRTTTGDVVRDERLGFRFDAPGDGWRVRDATPAEIRAIGTITLFEKRGRVLNVMALAPQTAETRRWLDGVLTQNLRKFTITEGGTLVEPTPVEVSGVRGTRRGARDGSGRLAMEAAELTRDGIVLIVVAGADEGDPGLDEALAGLELLD